MDALLPPQCAACGTEIAHAAALCPRCWTLVDFIAQPYCDRLGIPFSFDRGEGALSPAAMATDTVFHKARSVAHHRGPARDMVLALKFGARVDLAPMMGALMARAAADLSLHAAVIVPVPLHWTRRVRRRHNQAALLARAISVHLAVPVCPDTLRRRRRTRAQTGLTVSGRARNVAGAFVVPPGRTASVKDRRVILVDDVMTTGATANACARSLRRSGATDVDLLTFTRVVDQDVDAI